MENEFRGSSFENEYFLAPTSLAIDADGAQKQLAALTEAVAGAKVKVPTVDGPVMLAVPPGSSSGKVLRLKGKGFSRKDGTRGDQLIGLMVDLPVGDAALTAFVEGWEDSRNIRAALGV